MSYRLSDAWEYLERCGVAHDERRRSFAGFELADLFFRLVGPDPERVRGALRLQELVERAGAGFAVAGRADPSPASVTIWPPLSEGARWRVAVSHGGRPGDGNTLAEAVEAALLAVAWGLSEESGCAATVLVLLALLAAAADDD